ncbi:MAG: DUF1643 domain-containing protein [Poseidonibacter sp.]|uniref:DUF1643 domain-containing protein n=1 Tax=Poseidonibacter sp. TaxID=2321188 RepID=UPI00359D4BC6
MINLFALRATDPNELYKSIDPIGIDNDRYLKLITSKSDKVICAWGNHGTFNNRNNEVLKLIDNKYYLKMNKTGEPAHPLYLKSDLTPIKY